MEQKWSGFVKPNFGAPPAGYIPGFGRGATGFITRSDIGPAKMQENPFLKQKQLQEAEFNDNKYDEWSGYNAPLFKANEMDDEDKEAQQAYDKVDKHMDGRRKEQREKLVKDELKKIEHEKPSISQKFSDLKRELVKVSYEDWLNIPESADSSIKKQKRDKYVPVPDSLIAGFVNNSKLANKEVVQGINDLGEAKGILLKSKLDRASDNVTGQTVVDKTGYLTSLNSFHVNDETYLGDLKKARLLLRSATTTNPKNPDTWVSAARVEQLDGKLQQARVIINMGLEHCPQSEDLWIEASRLEKPDIGKSLLAKAVTVLPKSEKLWLTAARREDNKMYKRKILRKGLEHNSTSVRLWRELIEEEEPSEAKALLYKAVECLPKEIQLWLALAKLETYENAKAIINKGRKANPLEPQIWISAAKLQQTQSDSKQAIAGKIEAILSKAQQVLQKNGSLVKRQDWLTQATLCQKSENLLTCECLVNMSCGLGVEQGELETTVDKDAANFAEQGFINTARFMYKWGINRLSSKKLVQKAIALERAQNDKASLNKILSLAVQKCGDSEDFWIAISDKFVSQNDYDSALEIIDKGLTAVSFKENILLKKAKILIDIKKIAEAQVVLAQARQQYGLKSWIQSIELYCKLGNYKQAWKLCQTIYKREKDEKVFELAYRIQKKIGKYEDCRAILQKGIQMFEKSLKLWLLFVEHEIQCGFLPKARTILQKARVKNPKSAQLHEASVRLEIKAKNPKGALFCLSKGLSECPKSGPLWALAVQIQSRANRKKKASQAMLACPEDPTVNLCVAKIFWKQKKLEKAKKWFEKTVQMDPTDGDAWCYFYKFVLENEETLIQPVLEKIKSLELKKGRLWSQVLNSEDGWSLSHQDITKRVLQKIQEQMTVIQ